MRLDIMTSTDHLTTYSNVCEKVANMVIRIKCNGCVEEDKREQIVTGLRGYQQIF